MTRKYVFVSHANDDKRSLRGLIETLLDAGISLWIDRPEEVGLGERHLNCGRIIAGADWQEEIRRGLENACCVLFTLSRASNSTARSDELFREFEFGKSRNCLVVVQIEPIERSELNPFFRIRQAVDLTKPIPGVDPHVALQARYEALVDRLHEYLAGQSGSGERSAVPGSRRINDETEILHQPPRLLPYLTDRVEQQRQLTTALQAQLDRRINRAATFFAIGAYDDCVDSFVEQIGHVRLPAILDSNGLNNDVLLRSLQWPTTEERAENADDGTLRQLEDLKSQLRDALAIRATADQAAIEKKLANTPASWFFDIKIELADWRKCHPELMRSWLRWLSTLSLARVRYPMVILIYMVYPSDILRRLCWQRALHGLRINIKGIAADAEFKETVHLLPELHSVRFGDVEQWIREYVQDADREVLRRRLRKHFSVFGFRERRLSMYRIADIVRTELSDPSLRLRAS
jgi:hypothetical protein